MLVRLSREAPMEAPDFKPITGVSSPVVEEVRTVESSSSWWTVFVDAFRGTGGDPTKGPLGRAIVLLAVPMVLETVLESVFAVVDILFVSRLGDAAVAAVGLTESILTVIYTVAMGLSIGVTALVARRTGEGDPDGGARGAVQAIILGAVLSAAFGVVGVIWSAEMLRVLGAGEDVVATSLVYTQLMLGSNAVIVLLFLINAAFRGAGDAAIAMRVLTIANAVNIVLDPVLIFGWGPFPELGLEGAAIATIIGRGLAVVIQFYGLLKLGRHLRVTWEHLVIKLDVMARLIRLSATGTLQTFIGMASWVGLVRITAEFGAEALAGYTIAMRVVVFALLPAWGLSNAAATLVGQGLGAGDPDRAERATWIAGKMNFYFLGAVGILFFLFAPAIVSLFGGTTEASDHAIACLQIVSAGFFFYAYGLVLTAAFNGAGDVWTPTIINFFCFWLWQIPLAWALAFPGGLGADGVFIAITVSFSTLAVVSGIWFKRGKWKEVDV